MQIPQYINVQIEKLSEEGNQSFDINSFADAIRKWNSALDVLPPPRFDWEAWTWLNASIGDAYYQLGNFEAARQALFDALNGPGGLDNPFVQFRLGQCSLCLRRDEEAVDHLLRAYMLDGEQIFSADQNGARALNLLRERGLVR